MSYGEESTPSPFNSKYELIPVLETPEVSPGDTVKVAFYFTGYGVPDRAKLFVNLSSLDIGEEDLRFTKYVVSSFTQSGKKFNVGTGEKVSETTEVNSDKVDSFATGLEAGVFLPTPEHKEGLGRYDYPPIFGELTQGGAPMEMEFEISEDIEPGDYELRFALTTGNNLEDQEKHEVTSISKETVNLHVKNWYEQNRKMVNITSISLASLTLLVTLLSFTLNIIESLSQNGV